MVDERLTTTRTVRKRLDCTRSVDPEIIHTCLEWDLPEWDMSASAPDDIPAEWKRWFCSTVNVAMSMGEPPRASWGRHDGYPPARTMAHLGVIAAGAWTIVPIDRGRRRRHHAGWWGRCIAGRRHDWGPSARTAQHLRVVAPRPMAIVPIGRRGAWGHRAERWRELDPDRSCVQGIPAVSCESPPPMDAVDEHQREDETQGPWHRVPPSTLRVPGGMVHGTVTSTRRGCRVGRSVHGQPGV